MEPGSKFKQMVSTIENIVPIDSKVIVFSAFVEVLTLCTEAVEWAITDGKMQRRKYFTVVGKTSVKNKKTLFSIFRNKNDERAIGAILFLLIQVGGVGLNLVGCNYGIIMEPQYNPQIERQAIDRMYLFFIK